MIAALYALFVWMPTPLNVICMGVMTTFFFITFLRILALIKSIIPFV